jgi:hypothetical protein
LYPISVLASLRGDIDFDDPVGTDHDFLGSGLRKALYNYMHGVGLDADVREWFEPQPNSHRGGERQRGRRGAPVGVPMTTVPPDLIDHFLA